MWFMKLRIVFWYFYIFTEVLAYSSHGAKWKEKLPKNRNNGVLVNSDNDIYNLKLRHNSRFNSFNRDRTLYSHQQNNKLTTTIRPVFYRVRHSGWNYNNKLPSSTTTTTTTTTTTAATTKTTPNDGLFEDYSDLDYDEDETKNNKEYDDIGWDNENLENNNNNNHNNNNNDDDNFDDYDEDEDDDDSFLNDDDTWQAEEATEPIPPPVKVPVSSLTEYKWNHYGTRSRVEESRRQQLNLPSNPEKNAVNAVVEHYMKVRQEGECRKPVPKVISVQSIHPDTSKTYTPHCTILYRCAEDTGCCTNYAMRCSPKKQVLVHLYFYTKTLGALETKVEKLPFYNHTECACLEKSTMETSTTLLKSSNNPFYTPPENVRRCECPKAFTPKLRYDSRCTCDCEDNNEACIRMKKGKEFFSLTDRKCILDNKCGVPLCEYGIYVRQIGRCQKKQEKFDSYKRLTIK